MSGPESVRLVPAATSAVMMLLNATGAEMVLLFVAFTNVAVAEGPPLSSARVLPPLGPIV